MARATCELLSVAAAARAALVVAPFVLAGCDREDGATRVLQKMFVACQAQDGTALYDLAGATFRDNVAAQAKRAAALGPEMVGELYGYDKPIGELTPERFLELTLHSAEEEQNPCWRSEDWKNVDGETAEGQRSYVFELPGGRLRAVVLEETEQGWKVQKITPSVTRDEIE